MRTHLHLPGNGGKDTEYFWIIQLPQIEKLTFALSINSMEKSSSSCSVAWCLMWFPGRCWFWGKPGHSSGHFPATFATSIAPVCCDQGRETPVVSMGCRGRKCPTVERVWAMLSANHGLNSSSDTYHLYDLAKIITCESLFLNASCENKIISWVIYLAWYLAQSTCSVNMSSLLP